MKKILFLIYLVSSLLISGCQNLNKKVVPPELKKKVNSIQVASIIPQRVISANIEGSKLILVGMHFGVVGGVLTTLIDAVRNDKAFKELQKQLAPLKPTFASYDFRKEFHDSILKNIESLDWIRVDNQSLVDNGSKIRLHEDELYLKVYLDYRLSSDFTTLLVLSEISLNKAEEYRDNTTKKKFLDDERIAGNLYRYVSKPLPIIRKPREEYQAQVGKVERWYQKKIKEFESIKYKKTSKGVFLGKLNQQKRNKLRKVREDYTSAESNLKMAELWSKNDGELIKSYLTEAANEISEMLIADFSDSNKIAHYNDIKKNKDKTFYQKGFQLVSKSEDRAVVRYVKDGIMGLLCSLNNKDDAEKCIYSF